MPREDIAVRLRNGDRLLMDGGTGSEIQRRGIAITRGWDTAGSIKSWSARALVRPRKSSARSTRTT